MAFFFGFFLVLFQHLGLSYHTVFKNCHVVKQVKALEHHAHLGAVLGRIHLFISNVGSMVKNLSRGRCLQQVQAPQQGGLSGTGRADDTGYIACCLL